MNRLMLAVLPQKRMNGRSRIALRVIAIALPILLAAALLTQPGCEPKSAAELSESLPDRSTLQNGREQRTSAQIDSDAVSPSPTPSGLATDELFNVHCATCHGTTGDADGPGANSVYPPPRSFQSDRYKLVSSRNKLPDVNDFEKAIVKGMPGSSMPAFENLHADDRERLAEYVLKLWRNGARQALIRESLEEGDELDPERDRKILDRMVAKYTTANEKIAIPDFAEASDASVAQGMELYKSQGCVSCHGKDFRGNRTVELVEEHGQTIRPRDLINEPYRCGDDNASVFLRLRLGMPGTPHPSNDALTDEQLVDLVHALQSVRADEKVILTSYQRRMAVSVRDYLRQLDGYYRQ